MKVQMAEQLALLPTLLLGHINLALIALLIGVVISVPLGVWLMRNRRFEGPVMGIAGVIQTIPSLALLAFMVPVLGFLGTLTSKYLGVELSAIGYVPALIALSLYSVLPILQNTVTGIQGVDPALKEAALGVGMTQSQRLWQVELPQALPVMIAGVRTAAVWVVGMATLSTPIGAPSLGNYIFTGLQTRNYDAVTVGCIGAAVLALLLDNLIRALQVGFTNRRKGLLIGSGLGLVGLYSVILVQAAAAVVSSSGPQPVRLGAKGFTEQYICAQILAQQVERKTAQQTSQMGSLGSSVIFDALASGDLDAYVDFSGTIWTTVMKRSPPESWTGILDEVEKYLSEKHDVLLVGSLGYENRYAFGMRQAHMDSLGLRKLSELVVHGPKLSIAADYEFFGRVEWKSVQQKYGLDFKERRTMESSLMYQAVAQSQVDVISAYSTDGRIDALGLGLLEDDRSAIPPYHAIILVRGEFARANPKVLAALKSLVGQIDEVEMRKMNHEVDGKKRTPAEVAKQFLDGGMKW